MYNYLDGTCLAIVLHAAVVCSMILLGSISCAHPVKYM